MIKNYMEDCVQAMIVEVISNVDCCKCNKCRDDITAISLNMLPPKYVVTGRGELYTKLGLLQQQFDVDIITAITRAINIVKENPRH